MKRFCLRFLLLLPLSFSIINPANAYLVEINGSTGISDTTYKHEETNYFEGFVFEYESEVKTTNYFLDFHVFFKDVTAAKGPLAEAAFLGKTGSAFIQYTTTDITQETDSSISFSPTYSYKTEYDSETITTGTRIIIGPVILEPAYTNKKMHSETETLQLGIGGYIGDSQELVFTYSERETEFKTRSDYTTKIESLRYKGVFNIISNFYIAPHATLHNYHDDFNYEGRDVEAGVTFYPIKNLGVGPTFKISSDNDYNYDTSNNEITSSVDASFFPIPELGLNASLGSSRIHEKSDNSYTDSSIYESVTDQSSGIFFEIGITGRF